MDEKKSFDPSPHSDNPEEGLQLESEESQFYTAINDKTTNNSIPKNLHASTSEKDDLTAKRCSSPTKESCSCTCGDCHGDNLALKPKKPVKKRIKSLEFIVIIAMIYFVKHFFNSIYDDFFHGNSAANDRVLPKCGKLPSNLDYPHSFPQVNALGHLDQSIHDLALKYGEDILGPCYAKANAYFGNTLGTDKFVGNSDTIVGKNQDEDNPLKVNKHFAEKRQQRYYEHTTSASFPLLDIRSFAVTADDNIELHIEIVEFNNSIGENPSNPQKKNESHIRLYLTRIYDTQQQEEDKKSGSINEQDSLSSNDKKENEDISGGIIYLDQFMGHLEAHIKHIVLAAEQENDDEKLPKYKLQIVLPRFQHNIDENKEGEKEHLVIAPEISVFIKHGQVRAENMKFNQLYIRVGHGKVKLSSIEVKKLVAAVLDGYIHIPGVKFTESVAAGAIRGASTVLAKIGRHEQPYNLINMCGDGHVFTYLMTTVDNIDGMAAKLYIHRDIGAPPSCEKYPFNLPGDTYFYSDDDITHIDHNSTNIFKTGYFVSKDSESNVIVYSGAKSTESRDLKCCNRFRTRFYHNPNE